MKKLFKKPAFWVFLTVIIGLIVARIIQVRNNLKKTAATSGAKLGAGGIAKAFFTEPVYAQNETTNFDIRPTNLVMGNIPNTGGIKPLRQIDDYSTILPN